MPTVLKIGPYRFYFCSHEPHEPPHVHVDRDALSESSGCSGLDWQEIWDFPPPNCGGFNGWQPSIKQPCWRHGMGILALAADERVAAVKFSRDSLAVRLMDGQTIVVPLAWYPRLLNATVAQRKNWRLAGGGYGIHWPDVDEDLSTEGLLRGAPAPQLRRTPTPANRDKTVAQASRKRSFRRVK